MVSILSRAAVVPMVPIFPIARDISVSDKNSAGLMLDYSPTSSREELFSAGFSLHGWFQVVG
jgi:hypothetical protein